MKINWLILLCVALIQPFMLHSAETAGIDATTTIAKMPFTQEQIIALAQQAIANCITPQTCKYKESFQKKLAALLTFRSQLQQESLRDKSAGLIIKQQKLDRGNIQADQHADTTPSSSASNTQSWSVLFRNKLLIESADKQAEITWAYEAASLLIQYWPIYNTYIAQKHRERIESLMDNSASDATTLIQKNTIAHMPLTQDQITTIAQQTIASCMTHQTRILKAILQKKLATLLTFRSQPQLESLKYQNVRFLINQQNLGHGNIQIDQHAAISNTSLDANKQSWWQVFRDRLLTESADELTEITWARETASLLVLYWPTVVAYRSQKQRESVACKRDKADDSVKEPDNFLRKNRRHNDSPIPFMPMADEQASSSFAPSMYSNNDTLIEDCDYYLTRERLAD